MQVCDKTSGGGEGRETIALEFQQHMTTLRLNYQVLLKVPRVSFYAGCFRLLRVAIKGL